MAANLIARCSSDECWQMCEPPRRADNSALLYMAALWLWRGLSENTLDELWFCVDVRCDKRDYLGTEPVRCSVTESPWLLAGFIVRRVARGVKSEMDQELCLC